MTTTTYHDLSRTPGRHLAETRRLLALAGPSVMTGLGWMLMGFTDTVMVGRLGAAELGATALANSLYFSVFVCLAGLFSACSPLISQALGRGERRLAGVYLAQGRLLALVLAPPCALLFANMRPLLAALGQAPEVVAGASAYLAARALAVIPQALFSTHRAFLEGVGRPGRILRVVLAANVVNAVANRVLIFGYGPVPALGLAGAGYATSLSILALLAGALAEVRRAEYAAYGVGGARFDRARMREVVRLGWPMSAQFGIEVSVFAVIGICVGWLGPEILSAHQVAMSLLSLGFVIAGGISTAASVRVGEAVGRGDRAAVALRGRLALAVCAVTMVAVGALYAAAPRRLAAVYTSDAGVLELAAAMLGVAGLVVVFDGLQVVAAAALRATSDSRTAFVAHSVSYWLVGLPVGYGLAFPGGLGLLGFWIGIGAALAVIGVWLTRAFLRRAAAM